MSERFQPKQKQKNKDKSFPFPFRIERCLSSVGCSLEKNHRLIVKNRGT